MCSIIAAARNFKAEKEMAKPIRKTIQSKGHRLLISFVLDMIEATACKVLPTARDGICALLQNII